jgi:hypothetical protein
MGNRTRVRVGPIVAEITAASAERLDLRPGVLDGLVQGDGGAALSALIADQSRLSRRSRWYRSTVKRPTS